MFKLLTRYQWQYWILQGTIRLYNFQHYFMQSCGCVSGLRDRKLNRIMDHMFPIIKTHSWNKFYVSVADLHRFCRGWGSYGSYNWQINRACWGWKSVGMYFPHSFRQFSVHLNAPCRAPVAALWKGRDLASTLAVWLAMNPVTICGRTRIRYSAHIRRSLTSKQWKAVMV